MPEQRGEKITIDLFKIFTAHVIGDQWDNFNLTLQNATH